MAKPSNRKASSLVDALTALRDGDFSVRLPTTHADREVAALFNEIAALNGRTCAELEKLATTVGKEGKITKRAEIEGASGDWRLPINSVNTLIDDITQPIAEVGRVIDAVSQGDLSQSMVLRIDRRELKGEFHRIGNMVNAMVRQLATFASEVTRVAREVGTEGNLGGQANVKGVAGTWKDLTDNVNAMATNLTSQVRNIAEVTTAVASGDLSKKITVEVKGEIAELKDTINTMVDQLNGFASEVTRVAREVGTEGKLGGQAQVPGVGGTWKDLTDNVNMMADNLTSQVRNIAEVTTAVARGDLSKKITVDVKGEIAELKGTINTMVDQLNSFASEVTRVAREVGTEGKLGGQAQVPGVGGTWKDLTDNVNLMGNNLTNQVRGIAEVVTAVAQGNLKRKLAVEAKGEIAALAETINFMIDTLSTFGDQVTNMAREVGIEGKLGGQARVPGAAGLWRDLTDNVNQLAANLTNQVRSIAEVATAVTKGDLTQSIAVEASGEMAALKDNINEMIRNLKDQTLKNAEQDWLKTNLARFSRMLQGERDLATVSNLIMTELAPLVDAQYGVFYVARPDGDETVLELAASYGTQDREKLRPRFRLREGLIGQCAADKRATTLEKVPKNFMRIDTGLGQSAPSNVIIMPALFEDEVKAVLELATFGGFNEAHRSFLTQLMESVGIVLNTIAATMWTEGLLKQSQMLTEELQSRQTELTTKQDELHRTNAELQEKAELLEKEKKQVEAKNIEIEMARHAVEEKAEQLALTSKYKSEFLANMSHELRTPLNSLLILSKLLSENPAGNLNEKQTEFARTIHSAGTDLLNLINDILDLSKIESGTVSINLEDMELADLKLHVERTFRQIAKDKQLTFAVRFADDLPASIRTDEKRLQQIILNLLSNAFKFTADGEVTLSVRYAKSGWNEDNGALAEADKVVEFAVSDTGIGIPQDKLRLIFEAFQQADGTTSRKYGGTGLGLSISREIARLLGGELQVSSQPGDGSVFTLYIPLHKAGLKQIAARPQAGRQAEDVARLLPDDRDELAGNRWILVIGASGVATRQFIDLAHEAGLRAVHFDRGSGVMAFMRRNHPDAVLLDPDLTDISGLVLLDLIKNDPQTAATPVYLTSAAADGEDPAVLGAEKTILSASDRGATGKVFKHIKSRAARKRNAPSKAAKPTASLAGKCVLIIDDDVRNIFSLTSALEASGVDAAYAESGADGLDALAKNDAIDAVLVDIMMPDMDGYETIERIRALPGGDALPIIAVTAKAMAGDRQKCLDAGADDYIAKPVDIDLLNALLRVWVLATPRDPRVRDAAQ